MSKKTFKSISSIVLYIVIICTSALNIFAASSDFYMYFVNGYPQFVTFKNTITTNYANLTNTTASVSSLDLYADKVATTNSFASPCDGNDSTCSYTIQGICYNTIGSTTYTLISAYNNGTGYSAIFVTSDNKNYTKIIVNGQTSHFGGIASSGSYTYIAATNYIIRIPDSALSSCLNNKTTLSGNNNVVYQATLSSSNVTTIKIPSTVTASFLSYETSTDLLWIGGFNSSGTSYMYAYSGTTTDSASNNSTLSSYKYKMLIPSCSQGASFRDGKVVITRSYCRTPSNNQYVSELYCYNSYTKSGTTATLGTLSKNYMLPSMAEGVYIGATYTYIVYESNSSEYVDGMLRCTHVLAAPTTSLYQ